MKRLSNKLFALTCVFVLSLFSGVANGTDENSNPLQYTLTANEQACECEKKAVTDVKIDLPIVQSALATQAVEDGLIEPRISKCQHHICEGDRCYILDNGSNDTTKTSEISITTSKAIECDCGEDGSCIIVERLAAPPSVGTLTFKHSAPKDSPDALSTGDLVPREMVKLLIKNAQLEAKLELTEQLMQAEISKLKTIAAIEMERSKLETDVARFEAQLEMAEQITTNLVERTELAAKLSSAQDWISTRTAMEANIGVAGVSLGVPVNANNPAMNYDEQLHYIHEDLANIRRQLPLLRQTPVPFAISGSIPSANTAPASTMPLHPYSFFNRFDAMATEAKAADSVKDVQQSSCSPSLRDKSTSTVSSDGNASDCPECRAETATESTPCDSGTVQTAKRLIDRLEDVK